MYGQTDGILESFQYIQRQDAPNAASIHTHESNASGRRVDLDLDFCQRRGTNKAGIDRVDGTVRVIGIDEPNNARFTYGMSAFWKGDGRVAEKTSQACVAASVGFQPAVESSESLAMEISCRRPIFDPIIKEVLKTFFNGSNKSGSQDDVVWSLFEG